MSDQFFERPILNSPYEYPSQHWELDETGQPTQRIKESRRAADFITPIPKPKKRKSADKQAALILPDAEGLTTEEQHYDATQVINSIRGMVDEWRAIPDPNKWKVTPETVRLLHHWRRHEFSSLRPFFCQVEGAFNKMIENVQNLNVTSV